MKKKKLMTLSLATAMLSGLLLTEGTEEVEAHRGGYRYSYTYSTSRRTHKRRHHKRYKKKNRRHERKRKRHNEREYEWDNEQPEEETPVKEESKQEETINLGEVETEIVRLVNELRAEVGVQPVKVNAQLTQGAGIRAKEQVRRFDHTRPDGRDFDTVTQEVGYNWRAIAENIAYTSYRQDSAEEVAQHIFDMWRTSPGHYANMVSSSYDEIGVGVHVEGGTNYAAQLFGRR